jgi:lipopolysaccharide export system permease protein
VLLILTEVEVAKPARFMPLTDSFSGIITLNRHCKDAFGNTQASRSITVIVSRYFYRENLSTFLSVMLVVMILFASKHFVRYMGMAAKGELDMLNVFIVLGYYLVSALNMVLPFALFITVLITMGRMYQDNEITAMESCGIGVPQLLRKSALLAVVVAAFITTIAFWVSPWAEFKIQIIQMEAKKDAAVTLIEPGKFNQLNTAKGVFYAEEVLPNQQLKNVFIYMQTENGEDIFSAPTARIILDNVTNSRFLTLKDGTRFQLLSEEKGYRYYNYTTSGIRLDPPELAEGRLPPRAIKTVDLLKQQSLTNKAELQWRWSLPLCAFMLIHIGVLLSKTQPRQGRFGKLFLGLLVFIFYFYSLTISKKWIEKGDIPPEIGMGWVHILAIVFFVIVYVRQYGWPKKTVGSPT